MVSLQERILGLASILFSMFLWYKWAEYVQAVMSSGDAGMFGTLVLGTFIAVLWFVGNLIVSLFGIIGGIALLLGLRREL
jgi:hypothetical protein